MGFNDIMKKIFGSKAARDLKALTPIVESVAREYEQVKGFSNDELRQESARLKAYIQEKIQKETEEINNIKEQIERENPGMEEREKFYDKIDEIEEVITSKLEEVLNEIHPRVFAVVKETAKRFTENDTIEVRATEMDKNLAATHDFVAIEGSKAIYSTSWLAGGAEIVWSMIHYDVQLIGGTVLHQGKIAEMATGEGKTLVATLPVFLNALTGRGVHLVTVNDYLARRDSEWMGPLFQFHGLSVDCIDKHSPNTEARRNAYNCDITYGTNNEFGFDYLRDNMVINPDELVQRGHNYAIVDEVDSVLIDDARTPLIISGPTPKGDDQQFEELKPRIERIVKLQQEFVRDLFTAAKRQLASEDKEEQEEGALALFRVYKGAPKYKPLIKYLSEQGNKSKLLKTENFYMAENNKHMHIATDPLYFIVDEKQNSVELTDKGFDLITGDGDDPNFFVLPDISIRINEIETSEKSDAEKLKEKDLLIQDYSIKTERVHTINQLLKAYALFEQNIAYVVMDGKVKIVDEQTGRIMEGRRYSNGLHQALEAKENVTIEAATQTYATVTLQNYFRMYNKLSGMTGTAETEAGELWDIYKLDVVVVPTNRPIARDDKNDLIYKTVREKFNAVIEEVVSLTEQKRPVLVGTTSVEISELLSRMLKIRGIKHNVLNAKLHQKEADIVAEAGKAGAVTIATNMAGRGTDIKLSEEVKAAGGLAIIGTERHESRRVDRQLRGRSGRQGDPGTSQFYVSMEDNLMRLFGSERMIKYLDRIGGMKDGEALQAGMLTSRIEDAQRKVEENHFGVRKRLLEYDDVMNTQREIIYKKRRHALFGERLQVDIANMMEDVADSLVDQYHGFNNYEGFRLEVLSSLSMECPIDEETYKTSKAGELADILYRNVIETYQRKVKDISEQAMPVIKHVYQHNKETYKNIAVPITDGKKVFNVVTNLERSYNTNGEELMRSYEKSVVLAHIDEAWKEHLRELDDLKQAVQQTAGYEQKDPLVIYKFESFELFKSMVEKNNRNILHTLMHGQIYLNNPEEVQEAERKRTDLSKVQAQKDEFGAREGGKEKVKAEPVRVGEKIGRNAPCPCGSGKRYKNCHGKL